MGYKTEQITEKPSAIQISNILMQCFFLNEINAKLNDEQNVNILNKDRIGNRAVLNHIGARGKRKIRNTDLVFI